MFQNKAYKHYLQFIEYVVAYMCVYVNVVCRQMEHSMYEQIARE